jgi:prepilin-type N-terminal cleavage/methylation domain-containing protein
MRCLRPSCVGWPLLTRVPGSAQGYAGHVGLGIKTFRNAFTLIEIMLVIAILSLILGMGLPAFYRSFHREPMRKVLRSLTDSFATARAQAILQCKTVSVIFHPTQGSFAVEGATGEGLRVSSGQVPDSIGIEMLDVNLMDFHQAEEARVRFFANGTCDEFTLILHSDRNEWRKVTLDAITGIASVGDVQ